MDRKTLTLALCAIVSLGALSWLNRSEHIVPPAFAAGTPLEVALAESAADHRPVVAFYTADWCGPCTTLKKGALVDPRAEKLLAVTHAVLVDCTNGPPRADPYGIEGFPTLIELRDGKEVSRVVGAVPTDELIAWLETVTTRTP